MLGKYIELLLRSKYVEDTSSFTELFISNAVKIEVRESWEYDHIDKKKD